MMVLCQGLNIWCWQSFVNVVSLLLLHDLDAGPRGGDHLEEHERELPAGRRRVEAEGRAPGDRDGERAPDAG